MNRETWEAYRSADGLAKRRLLDQLIREEEPLAQHLVAKFVASKRYNTDAFRNDLLQATRIGMMRAVDAWKPDKGTFANVADVWCRYEMQVVAEKSVTPITIPRRAHLTPHKQNAMGAFTALHGREPDEDELAKMGITVSDLNRSQKAQAQFRHLAGGDLSEPIAEDEPIEDVIDRKRDTAALVAFMKKLTPAEKREFWAGKRPDLVAKAKEYVETRRTVRGK